MLVSMALDPDSSSPRLRVPPRLRVKPRRVEPASYALAKERPTLHEHVA